MARASAVALALVLLAAVFLRAGHAPVAILDSWADWKYGQWIWENKRLPEHDPFSLNTDPKIQARDGSWLAEVAYYLVVARSGLEGVSLLHALLEAAKAGLFLLAVRRATGSLGTAIAATALMEAACWPFFATIRTGTPAEVCWAGLLLACSARIPSRADVLAAPVVVALWANLSPTFGFAFVLLGSLLVGRFLQAVRAQRRLTTAVRDPAVKRLRLMLGLSVAAACFNPYWQTHLQDFFGTVGLSVLPARLWPTLIPVGSWESRVVIASVIIVLFVLRLSPRPLTLAEVLLMASFAIGAWFDKRVAPWWLMLAPWLLAPHLQAMAEALGAKVARPGGVARWPRLLSWSPYLLGGLAVVLVLFSPAVRWVVGHPLPVEDRVSPLVPSHLAAELPARRPEAPGRRVLTLPYWWSDYLLWQLPPGDRVFWYSRPEAFMPWLGKAAPGMDPSVDEWRKLIDQQGFDVLLVQADSTAGLYSYLDRLPRERPARALGALLAAQTPLEAAAIAQAEQDQPSGEWKVIADNTSTKDLGCGLLVVRRADP
jgi:hypothetical protein